MIRKVLFISHDATRSGAPHSLRDLIRQFRRRYGWDSRVLIRAHWGAMDLFDGVAPSEIYYRYATDEQCRAAEHGEYLYGISPEVIDRQHAHTKRVLEELRDWHPDLVYSNTAMNGDILAGLDGLAPVVIHVHELAEPLNTLDPFRMEHFLNGAAFYFACSGTVRTHLISQRGIPAELVELAPLAVDVNRIEEQAAAVAGQAIENELGLSGDEVLIGGVGTVRDGKGADVFLDLARTVRREKMPALRFVWLGEGPRSAKLSEAAAREWPDGTVRFVGGRDNPYPYLARMDVYALTSREEAMGLTMLEAAALKTPTLAFAGAGGPAEFVRADTGCLIEGLDGAAMARTLADLIHSPRRRKRLGEQAHARVLRAHNLDRSVPLMYEALRARLSHR